MKKILFYISGHGYGHAVRTKEVIRALLNVRSDLKIIIRTTAPEWIFQDIVKNPNVSITEAILDSGVHEDDPLHINYSETIRKLSDFLKHSLGIVYNETAYGIQNGIDLIVSDIPAFAGEVAARLNIPCIGMSNFLWDWIYEPMVIDEESRNSLLLSIRTGYSKMSHWVRYPFGHESSMFEKITDVSLVFQNEVKPAETLISKFQLNIPRNQRVVYIAMRGGINSEVLAKAAKNANDFAFILAEASDYEFPSNVYKISPFPQFSFADLINFADIIVGKPGYGLVSTCVGLRKPLLYPRRHGFREDEILIPAASNYIPMLEIPHEDFYSGNWTPYLVRLNGLPIPDNQIDTNGAKESVQIITDYLK